MVMGYTHVHTMSVIQCGCIAGVDDGEMRGFYSSLERDQAAVSDVCEGLHGNGIQEFVTALNACRGTIYTSGIGQYTTTTTTTTMTTLFVVCREVWGSGWKVCGIPQFPWSPLTLCTRCRMGAWRSWCVGISEPDQYCVCVCDV